MIRFAAVGSVVFSLFLLLAQTGPNVARGQHPPMDGNSLASNLSSSSRIELDGFGRPNAHRSTAVIGRLPSSYFADLPESAKFVSAQQPDRASIDDIRENWIVVIMLGLSFCVGLVITISMIRRATINPAPHRIF